MLESDPVVPHLRVHPGVTLYRGLGGFEERLLRPGKPLDLTPKAPLVGHPELRTILEPHVHLGHVNGEEHPYVSFSLHPQIAVYYATHRPDRSEKSGCLAQFELSVSRGVMGMGEPSLWEGHDQIFVDPRALPPQWSETGVSSWIKAGKRSTQDREILLVRGVVRIQPPHLRQVSVKDWDGVTKPWVAQGRH